MHQKEKVYAAQERRSKQACNFILGHASEAILIYNSGGKSFGRAVPPVARTSQPFNFNSGFEAGATPLPQDSRLRRAADK